LYIIYYYLFNFSVINHQLFLNYVDRWLCRPIYVICTQLGLYISTYWWWC